MKQLMSTMGTVGIAVVLVAAPLSPSLQAAETQLAKSGTAKVHSGWAGVGEVKEVGKNHAVWVGVFYGTSFNDEGKGFLHKMAWICPGTSDIIDGAIVHEGFCTLTDMDGDQLYGPSRGKGPVGDVGFLGTVTYSGGTGKYAGIHGSHVFRCNAIGQHGQVFCTQEANYKLP